MNILSRVRLIPLMCVIVFAGTSCKKEKYIKNAGPRTDYYVTLEPGYLGLCSDFFTSTTSEMWVTVSVDVQDGGTQRDNYYNNRYEVPVNNDKVQNLQYRQFDVQLPESGTFIVSVSVDILDCVDCCNGPGCQDGSEGKPSFREVDIALNKRPQSGDISAEPTRVKCY